MYMIVILRKIVAFPKKLTKGPHSFSIMIDT